MSEDDFREDLEWFVNRQYNGALTADDREFLAGEKDTDEENYNNLKQKLYRIRERLKQSLIDWTIAVQVLGEDEVSKIFDDLADPEAELGTEEEYLQMSYYEMMRIFWLALGTHPDARRYMHLATETAIEEAEQYNNPPGIYTEADIKLTNIKYTDLRRRFEEGQNLRPNQLLALSTAGLLTREELAAEVDRDDLF